MRLARLLIAPVLVFASICVPAVPASGAGDVTLGLGGVWPQGSFAAYGDPGFTVLARGRLEVPGFPALSGWLDVNYVNFSAETFETELSTGDISFPADQTTTQQAVTVHIGAQLGSSSRKAFFRPRAAVGVGFYFFDTTLKLERKDADDDEEPLYTETLDSQACFGWRSVVGADFYFDQKWGVSVDLFYDHVSGLNRVEGDEETHRTSVYQGFAVGVVIPFGSE
jgi:hypothetical protein